MPVFRSVVSVLVRELGETFRYILKAGPAAACGRPPARQRHDSHRGAGLTLTTRVSQSSHGGRRGTVSGAVVRGTVPGTGWVGPRTGPDPDWGSGLVIAAAAMPIPAVINAITTTPMITGHRGRSRRQPV